MSLRVIRSIGIGIAFFCCCHCSVWFYPFSCISEAPLLLAIVSRAFYIHFNCLQIRKKSPRKCLFKLIEINWNWFICCCRCLVCESQQWICSAFASIDKDISQKQQDHMITVQNGFVCRPVAQNMNEEKKSIQNGFPLHILNLKKRRKKWKLPQIVDLRFDYFSFAQYFF